VSRRAARRYHGRAFAAVAGLVLVAVACAADPADLPSAPRVASPGETAPSSDLGVPEGLEPSAADVARTASGAAADPPDVFPGPEDGTTERHFGNGLWVTSRPVVEPGATVILTIDPGGGVALRIEPIGGRFDAASLPSRCSLGDTARVPGGPRTPIAYCVFVRPDVERIGIVAPSSEGPFEIGYTLFLKGGGAVYGTVVDTLTVRSPG
jgi:hypothetical protein